MAKRLQLRRGTDTQRLAITPAQGEPFWTTDTQKLYCGDGSTAGGILVGPQTAGTTELNAYESLTAISAAGTTTITLAALNLRKTAQAAVSGGAGTYTHVIVLDTTNANAGDVAVVTLDMAASTNPTLEVRNATSGGTLLDTIHDTSGTETLEWSGEYVFNGTAWVKVRSFFQLI